MRSFKCCSFGANILNDHLKALRTQASLAKSGGDIEYVHKTRVASRRMNAALAIFGGCFHEDGYSRWREEIRKLLKSFGEARDADVQIAFLESSLRERGSKGAEPAIKELISAKKRRRRELQTTVLRAVDRFNSSKLANEMSSACQELMNRPWEDEACQEAYNCAFYHISRRIDGLLALKDCVRKEKDIRRHHEMRIEAKRLRYTIELFSPLYEDGLKEQIDSMKGLQDALGEMHDLDIWIEYLPGVAKDLAARDEEKAAGMMLFLKELKKKRRSAYKRFVSRWAQLWKKKFFRRLQDEAGSKTSAKIPENRQLAFATVRRTAERFDPDTDHSEHVCRLSVKLFDELSDLHKLGKKRRRLLEAACFLHDIGWYSGGPKHHKSSLRIILENPDLPFTSKERFMAGSIVRYHTKGMPKDGHFNLTPLTSKERETVLKLAAILRFADGLDYSHTSAVMIEKVGIEAGKVKVLCSLSEKVIGLPVIKDKRDLFEKVYNSKLSVVWKRKTRKTK